MTIICALHDPEHGCTWIAGDRNVLMGDIFVPGPPKWVLHGDYAVGACGWSRLQHLIEGAKDELFHGLTDTLEFTARLHRILAAEAWKSEPDAGKRGPPDFEINIVLASPDGVWGIDGILGFDPAPPGALIADGAGREVAFGAAYAAKRAGLNPQGQVLMAVNAAVELHHDCGGEAWVHKLEGSQKSDVRDQGSEQTFSPDP